MSNKNITSVLKESRVFPPREIFSKQAHIPSMAEYDRLWNRAKDKPEECWAECGKALHWYEPWTKVLDWKEPFCKWFVDAKINACYNCVDRHVVTARRNKAAIIWEGEPGDSRVLRYQDLYREVCKFANVMKSKGIV